MSTENYMVQDSEWINISFTVNRHGPCVNLNLALFLRTNPKRKLSSFFFLMVLSIISPIGFDPLFEVPFELRFFFCQGKRRVDCCRGLFSGIKETMHLNSQKMRICFTMVTSCKKEKKNQSRRGFATMKIFHFQYVTAGWLGQ